MRAPRRFTILAFASGLLLPLAAGAVAIAGFGCVLYHGDRATQPLQPPAPRDVPLAAQLRADVEVLAGTIGQRNTATPGSMRLAASFIAGELSRAGYRVKWQEYDAPARASIVPSAPGSTDPAEFAATAAPGTERVANLIAEIPGSTRPEQIVIIGAHYDSVNHKSVWSPGANDNASGTAAVLALARRLATHQPRTTLRFVLFACEEPPHFWTDSMGSLVYARDAKARGEQIVAMLSIETIGCYSDAPNSQDYPPLIDLAMPSEGNFIGFVGMIECKPLVKRCVEAFRAATDFPCEGAALTSLVPRVGSSDHWSFWKQGYPALMVTDTAPYRYPHYHKPTDTPDKLDYARMARVVEGLEGVIRNLTSEEQVPPTESSQPRGTPDMMPEG